MARITIAQLEAQIAALECGLAAQAHVIARLTARIEHLEAARPLPQRELPLAPVSDRRAQMQAAKEEAMRTGRSVLVA